MDFKSILLVLIVVLIWASNFIVIKIGVTELEPLIVLGLRFFCAGLIFLPFMKWPGWKQARMIMLVGLLMGPLHQGLLYYALETMPAGLMSIILQSNVLMTTFIGWIFLKEKIGWRTWTGIAMGLIGIFILLRGSDLQGNISGFIMAFASAFFIAVTYIAMKKVDTVHAPTYIVLMSLPISPLIFISSFILNGTQWTQNMSTIHWGTIAGVVAYQAIILSLSHMIWQRLLTVHPVSLLTPWTLLIPALAMGMAVIFFGESVTIPILIGGGLTILGVAITTFRRLKRHSDKDDHQAAKECLIE